MPNFGPTMVELQNIVKEFVIANGIETPFKQSKPGYDWVQSFLHRYNLKLTKGLIMQLCRTTARSDPFLVYGLYDLLEKTVENLGLSGKPKAIWNLDESGFPIDPSHTKIIGPKGKNVKRTTHGNNRIHQTVLACCNADGDVLDPLFVFKGINMQSVWKGEHALPNTYYGVSPSGWMTSVIFEDWFNGFIKEVTIRPLLLIFDGHLTHLTLKTITTAMEENITILKLVAHSIDTMHPLVVSCFSPLKSYYERALTFNESHGGRIKLNVSKFVDVCCSVWHKGISSTNAISGFKATGIFPVNRNKYKLESFDAKKLETYNVWKANGSPLDKYGDADLSKIISIEEAVANPVYHDISFSVDTPCSSKETMVESPERTPTVPRAMDLNRTPSAEVTPSKMSAVRLIKACQRHAPKVMKYVLSLVPDDSDESFQSIIRSRKTSNLSLVLRKEGTR